ncbi:hypothetical protein BGY98DRAFT_1183018 [Russula aff. rugulosa BPL654]|nr:hypothetical protein BGY98DRAFT_1183018 [Russula aff. rugulosa BPL654]
MAWYARIGAAGYASTGRVARVGDTHHAWCTERHGGEANTWSRSCSDEKIRISIPNLYRAAWRSRDERSRSK